jgi:hypothetical protein
VDDSAAVVHGRRGGALAEAGGGPRGEGAGPSRTTVGCSWRLAGTPGGQRASRRDGGGRGRRRHSVGKFGSLTASFRFRARLRKFSRPRLVYI